MSFTIYGKPYPKQLRAVVHRFEIFIALCAVLYIWQNFKWLHRVAIKCYTLLSTKILGNWKRN